MQLLDDIKDELGLLLDDLADLMEVADLLFKGEMSRAKDKIRYLDTAVRDYCVEHFNEDMLRQVDMQGNGSQGQYTGKKYGGKKLAEKVELGIAAYLLTDFNYYRKHLKEILDAQKTDKRR